MADIRVTGSANLSAVTNGLKKIGTESANMSKSTSRAGQSILALGQGLEDFAVAGMRGALNNIPQFIQMLGAGAGIAGGATIALVAINELVKGIDRLLDKRHAAENTELAKGLGYKELKASEEELRRIDKLAEKAAESMVDVQKEFAKSQTIRGLRERFFTSESEVSVAKTIFEMEQRGATEQEKKIAGIQEEIRLLNVRKSIITESIGEQRQVPVQIQAQIAKEQEAVDNWKNMRKAIEQAYAEARKRGLEQPVNEFDTVIDRTTGERIQYRKSQDEIDAQRRANIERETAAVNASINDNDIVAARIAAGVAEEQLATLRKKLTAAQDNLYIAERETSVSTKEIANKQEILRLEEKRARLIQDNTFSARNIPILGDLAGGGINKLLDIANAEFDRRSKMSDGLAYGRGGDMLSSAGRIGASGSEFNASVATVNYQRESLNELRKISRNTGRGGRATYN